MENWSDLSHTPHPIYPILEAELGSPGRVIVRHDPCGLVSYEELECPTKAGTRTLEGLSYSGKWKTLMHQVQPAPTGTRTLDLIEARPPSRHVTTKPPLPMVGVLTFG
ncbi:hypothetical protein TorRG33x02_167410 [Trema orientale]|uniref:Uncharacterized protein n=1 Tax=Trema orientale TaxID=63057 RepID=A0A2P5EPT7_TREOI|nr:hypothetical protein TorRG33x02_167410 [Trema orientale]